MADISAADGKTMEAAVIWYLMIGFILVLVGLSSSFFERLPVTTSIVYFAVGLMIGPLGFQLIETDFIQHAAFYERITEIVVIISLFVAGLKLRQPLGGTHWAPIWRLAFVSMAITVGLIASFAHYLLNLPWGAGVLLGAVLAPTDPVLASAVQVKHPDDRDRLRFSLTGEAGMNDGTAFPFVMLGLGLLGLHEIGDNWNRWLLVDLVWAVIAGLASGWLLGNQVTRVVAFLRRRNQETVILDDFLALGLISLAYGAAHVLNAYGFLAVFAAGLSMRRIENTDQKEALQSSLDESIPLSKAVRSFTEQMERIGEVISVILLGAMFKLEFFMSQDLWLIPILLFLIRPLSVYMGLSGLPMGNMRRPLIAWFGIRGIGSIYYLTYAITHGVSGEIAQRLSVIVYCTIVVSIFAHGLSGLPIMNLYQRSADNSGGPHGSRAKKSPRAELEGFPSH